MADKEPVPKPSRRDSYPRDRHSSFHPAVFLTAAGLIIVFVALSLLFPQSAEQAFGTLKSEISSIFGWFFIVSVNIFLLVCVYLLFSRHGKVRLGGQDAKPDFGFLTWMSMLFSAGMGIGLVFWSVAEPVGHFLTPPLGAEEGSAEAADHAMAVTYFHWGLHAWGIYALMGLSLAYFAYNKGLPLTIRSTLHPLLGSKVDGPLGNIVDIVASVATLFGVATSLGFGVQQINAGLNYTFDVPEGPWVQAGLIAGITVLATISVVTGLEVGIRRLSESNMALALGLMVFVFIAGPTLFILKGFFANLWTYVAEMPGLAAWTSSSPGGGWREGWTIFYWAWWIAWSPFVGMFIARISKGRTIREFVLGVLLVPTAITFIWLSIFGNAALFEVLNGDAEMAANINANAATALFELLGNFPLETLFSIVGIIVIVLFFVTSSDSGSLVIDIITAGGHADPPVVQRVFWAITEGVVAAVLLLVGGANALAALQTASIVTGLPFAVVILFIAWSLIRHLRRGPVESPGDSVGKAAKQPEMP